ncbi:hypothetical protein [Brevundimonas vesicularis]|uniref:hypothetical protein n=1 Tax=Brevundimonas vesicularis TaxID=41276 RepID=UPI0028AE4E0B|nr:hypothetical protein [Brevundimonas vesicularis]
MTEAEMDRIIAAMRRDHLEHLRWRERTVAEFEARVGAIVRKELTGLLHPSVQRTPPAPVPANDHTNQPDSPPPPAAA